MNSGGTNIKVLLAEDHHIVRQGLAGLIQRQAGLEVVGQAADGREAVRLAKDLHPDLVLMDVGMPGLNGIEATRQIRAASAATRVLALSVSTDPQMATEMLRAGASGYLLKTCGIEELVQAVHSVMAGQTYLSPTVGAAIAETVISGRAGAGAAIPLTPRQREVLQLLAEGLTTKEIADRLKRSRKTVEMHRLHIMDALELHTVADLTKYALRKGLISLDG
jgi:DNA-binding NarL/FixJ family response regulator